MKQLKKYLPVAGILSAFLLVSVNAQTPAKLDNAPEVQPQTQDQWAFLPDVVATIGKDKITKQELVDVISKRFAGMPGGKIPASIPPSQLKPLAKNAVQDMIDRTVLLDLAKKAGIVPSPELVKKDFDKAMKELTPEQVKMFEERLKQKNMTMASLKEKESKNTDLQKSLAITNWITQTVADKVKVQDADAEKFYRTNQERFKTPDTCKVAHILVMPKVAKDADAATKAKADAEAKKKIDAIYAKLKQGADFGELASKESECPSGKQKGVLPEFGKDSGMMVKEFEDASFKLKPNEFSQPVKTRFGYHIIKMLEIKKAGYIPFEKIKDDLKKMLKNQEVNKAVRALIDAEKAKLNVKINI
jgi:parvulin-like peptidyl-prolyl isomerase